MISVHDHGHVKLLNLAGPTPRTHDYSSPEGGYIPRMFDADDRDPANAARMSFDQMDSGRTREADLKLCDYLMKNHHTTPFEMIEVWLDMKLPIFVARQFVRHRTVSINEVSARYILLPEEWYIPEIVYAKPDSGAKQGRAQPLPAILQNCFKYDLDKACRESYERYLHYANAGAAPEQARCFLHVNHYTHWLWKQDLHNIMNFLRLRDHFHAQGEAIDYAQAVDTLLREQLPDLMSLYDKYRRQKVREVLAYMVTPPDGQAFFSPVSAERITEDDKARGWLELALYGE